MPQTHLPPHQTHTAHPALETISSSVPVTITKRYSLILKMMNIIVIIKRPIDHDTDLRMNECPARLTCFPMMILPTLETMRHVFHGDILVTCQGEITDPAAEVLHMPEPVLCCGVL